MIALRQDAESQAGQPSMRSPWDIQTDWWPIGKQRVSLGGFQLRRAIFPLAGGSHLPAQGISQGLHAITNPQNWPAAFQDIGRDLRRSRIIDRGRPTREDKPLWVDGDRTSSAGVSQGNNSLNTCHSRTRRAISWEY